MGLFSGLRKVHGQRRVPALYWKMRVVMQLRKMGSRRRPVLRAAWVLSALVVLFGATAVHAKLCGDNVQGLDVPCDCGDTVVSDVALSDDPVTSTVCPGDGLIVRAVGAAGITIDLSGKTLRGSGQGTGLWVLFGGAGGARVVSTGPAARLEGFRDGVVAQGSDSLALLDNVVAAGSRRDGVRVHGGNYSVNATQVVDSGHDGFALGGHDFQITASHALHSGRYGYFVMATRGAVGMPGAGNTSQGSGEAGFAISGMWISVSDCVASAAAKNGVELGGMEVTVEGCVASGNIQSGIVGDGSTWRLGNNHAVGNGYDGLVIHGMAMTDEGGNGGAGNRGQRWHRPAVQCTINGVTCAQ